MECPSHCQICFSKFKAVVETKLDILNIVKKC
jgi:hypothetical protein